MLFTNYLASSERLIVNSSLVPSNKRVPVILVDETCLRGYKTFFMLNSLEHDILC